MVGTLEDTKKALTKAEHLAAGQYGYLKEARKHAIEAKNAVESTKLGPGEAPDKAQLEKEIAKLKEAHKKLETARREAVVYVGRGEIYAERAEEDVIKNLKKLAAELPEEMKVKVEKVERDIAIAENTLTKNLSRYGTRLKDDILESEKKIGTAIADIQLEERGAKNAKDAAEAAKKIAEDEIGEAIGKIVAIIQWIAAIIGDFEVAKKIEEKIEAWVGA